MMYNTNRKGLSIRYYINKVGLCTLTLLTLGIMIACSRADDDASSIDGDLGIVPVELALSVSSSRPAASTRMTSTVVQSSGSGFRGIQDLWLIPFKKQGKIVSGDIPEGLITDAGLTMAVSENSASELKQCFDIDLHHSLQMGVASFLAYGRAKTASGNEVQQGSLAVSYTTTAPISSSNFVPESITIAPVSIHPEGVSSKIAEYLTKIANAGEGTEDGKWCTTSNPVHNLFKDFANYKDVAYEPFAGSSTNILTHINTWYSEVNTQFAESGLKAAVLTAIKDPQYVTFDDNTQKITALVGTTEEHEDMRGYPAGLPDGSVGLKWDDNQKAFIAYYGNPLDRYVYPAELYYFSNSRIYTAGSSKKEKYTTSSDAWDTFIENEYENKGEDDNGALVDAQTRSIALIEPLQYGVACLDVKIQADCSESGDDNNKIYAYNDDYQAPTIELTPTDGNTLGTFPVTAILIGGQRKQGFEFTPKYPDETVEGYLADEDPEYIIYDSSIADEKICLGDFIMTSSSDNFSPSLYTLALQSKIEQSVKVVLEFENNSGHDFLCESGIIYNGTKFYLMASVVNQETSEEEKDKQVLTKDHMTTIKLTIKGLSSAYNSLPNLSSDKVRIFETVTAGIKQWEDGSTKSHEVYNW